jgi:ribosomal protein S27AE
MGHTTYCLKEDCAFLSGELTRIAGRRPSNKFCHFPGHCNHAGGPEMDEVGQCRYAESIGYSIEGNHESIDRKRRCPYCGAATIINDVGLTWCISKTCKWTEK